MPHLTRRELKKDEFREKLARGAELLAAHRGWIWRSATIVLVLAGAILLWRWYTGRQQAQADAQLAQALELFEAPVGAGESAGQLHFGTAQEKFTAAERAFGQIAQRYPWTRAGDLARYYAAVSLAQLGKYQDAANWLQPLVRSDRAGLGPLAQFELAQVEEQRGQGERAVALYRGLLEHPSPLVPRPLVLLALGDHFRHRDPAQARQYYEQIKKEFAGTSLAQQAEQRLEELGKT